MSDQKTRIGLFGVLGLLLLAAVAYWAKNHFVQETHQVDEGPSAEARRLPYFGAQRILEKLGQPVTPVSTGTEARPGPHDVLLFAVSDENETSAQLQRHLAWVRAGGTLILNVEDALRQSARHEQAGLVPLLQQLNVRIATDDDDPLQAGVRNRVASLSLPDAAYIHRVDNCFCWNLHAMGPRQPWFGDDSGKTLLAYQEGAGVIVLLNNDNLLSASRVREQDNAEVLWRLTQLNGHPPRVWLVWQGQALPWQTLLWRNFGAFVVTIILFGVFALWRGATRFGPLLPPPQPVRRSLIEHLDACGRWFWQQRKHAVLLDACRAHLRRTLQLHRPRLATLPAPQLAPKLASLSGLDEAAIGNALSATGSRDTHEFTAQVALLQALTLAVENQHRKL